MCNSYTSQADVDAIVEELGALRLPVVAIAATGATAAVRPTDAALIIRPTGGGVEVVARRWGFAPSRPKAGAVINVRAERRRFDAGRCLIPATSFDEFTGDRYPKTRWRFTVTGAPWFCIAGLWRAGADERFTMLTVAPGPDVAPYHDRQIVILERSAWARWLAPEPIDAGWLHATPAGALTVARAP